MMIPYSGEQCKTVGGFFPKKTRIRTFSRLRIPCIIYTRLQTLSMQELRAADSLYLYGCLPRVFFPTAGPQQRTAKSGMKSDMR